MVRLVDASKAMVERDFGVCGFGFGLWCLVFRGWGGNDNNSINGSHRNSSNISENMNNNKTSRINNRDGAIKKHDSNHQSNRHTVQLLGLAEGSLLNAAARAVCPPNSQFSDAFRTSFLTWFSQKRSCASSKIPQKLNPETFEPRSHKQSETRKTKASNTKPWSSDTIQKYHLWYFSKQCYSIHVLTLM